MSTTPRQSTEKDAASTLDEAIHAIEQDAKYQKNLNTSRKKSIKTPKSKTPPKESIAEPGSYGWGGFGPTK